MAKSSIGIDLLRKKMGATSPLKKFRYFIKELAKSDHLPDYTIELTEADQIIFHNRRATETIDSNRQRSPTLSTEAYERAKKYAANESVYALEQDWIQFWRDSGCPTLKSADAAFVGFCKSRFIRIKNG